jgi:indole-3-glycerol phosphate synthase
MSGRTPGFTDALLGAATPVIMEVKLRNADGTSLVGTRSLAGIVADYEAAGAPCLSVVTGRWFGGTPDLLREVARLTDLPVLQKDFITKDNQLADARELGASAVLLTAQLLPESVLRHLIESCLRLGLTPFVEVVSKAEADAVVRGEDCVVAVNNKDIRQRERDPADISRSTSLLPAVLRSGTRCPVSASGIDHPATAARLVNAGFAGLLIGTGLLRAGSLHTWRAEFERHLSQMAASPGSVDSAAALSHAPCLNRTSGW